MGNWLDRSGYMTIAAFVGGALIAAIIVVVVVVVVRDGDSGGPTATATPTSSDATATPAGTPTDLPAPTASNTAFASPDEAVAAFVTEQLASIYIGECPRVLSPGEEPSPGYCSIELYTSDSLATYNIGRYGSEALGEAVVLPNDEGGWLLTFLDFPPLDATITVGADAMVFQAQDCLRFRAEPSSAAAVVSCQIDGAASRVTGGPVSADGITWWQLDGLGWASASYLAPATN